MAMRAISSATIAFGLVSIPVKLFSCYESSAAIRFNQIHKQDGSRVKQQLVSSKTGEVVAKDDIVKGYEFAKGQYVLFTPEELKALEEKSTYTIDIAEFVPADEVDRMYLEKLYYLGPDKGGARAYRLLSKALQQSGRAALAKYAAVVNNTSFWSDRKTTDWSWNSCTTPKICGHSPKYPSTTQRLKMKNYSLRYSSSNRRRRMNFIPKTIATMCVIE